MLPKTKTQAQRRVDQIDSFRRELKQLEDDGVVALEDDQLGSIDRYHSALLKKLTEQFDVDATHRARQLSLGMKITSFLGAIALGASLFFLFYRFWGDFSTVTQVAVLITAPLLGLLAAWVAVWRDRSGYFAKLFASVSLTCFVLDLSMLGQIFNISPSENVFVVWALFAFLLAYAIDSRLLLAAGIICLTGYLSARMGTWSGCYWIDFGEWPENFFPAVGLLFLLSFFRHDHFAGFRATYRVFALLLFFIPALILANWGEGSYLPFSSDFIEGFYQLLGFFASAGVIWLGIRKQWIDMVNTGNVFFTIFLYTKFYDWWWDWLPKYLFFLLIALVAILMLLVFKRLRTCVVEEKT